MIKCAGCVWAGRYSNMGCNLPVCTRIDDLNLAVRECEKEGACAYKITKDEVRDLQERIEDLETLLFAFVLEMGITHADRQGKNKDEISDRVLEVIREKEKRVLYPQMRKRMQEAKARLEAKEAAEDAEE